VAAARNPVVAHSRSRFEETGGLECEDD
jgi:hypothetical protein